MLYHGPEWHSKLNSMEKNNKRFELTTRKKDGRPKSIKKDLSSRPTKGWVLETKGRKEEAQPVKIRKSKRESSDKNWAGIPKDYQSSGSSRHAAKLG